MNKYEENNRDYDDLVKRQIVKEMISDIVKALSELGFKVVEPHHKKGGRKKKGESCDS